MVAGSCSRTATTPGCTNLGEGQRQPGQESEFVDRRHVRVTIEHEGVIGLWVLLGHPDHAAGPVVLSRAVLEDSSTDNEVKLLGIRNMVDLAKGLVLSGRLDHKLAKPEQPSGK